MCLELMTFSFVVGVTCVVALLSINFSDASPVADAVRQGAGAVDPDTGLPIVFVDLSDESQGSGQTGQPGVVSIGAVSSGTSVAPAAPEVQVIGLNDNPSQGFSQAQESGGDDSSTGNGSEDSAQMTFVDASDESTGITSAGNDGDQSVQTDFVDVSDGSAETSAASASNNGVEVVEGSSTGTEISPQSAGNSAETSDIDVSDDGNRGSDVGNGGADGNEGQDQAGGVSSDALPSESSIGENVPVENVNVEDSSMSGNELPVENVNVEDSSTSGGTQGSEGPSSSGNEFPVENVNVEDSSSSGGAQSGEDTTSSGNELPVENVDVEDSLMSGGSEGSEDPSGSGNELPVENVNVEDSTTSAGAQGSEDTSSSGNEVPVENVNVEDTASSGSAEASQDDVGSDVPVESINVEDSPTSGGAQGGDTTGDGSEEDGSEIDIDVGDESKTVGGIQEDTVATGESVTPLSPSDAPVATPFPGSSDPEATPGSDELDIDASPSAEDEIDDGQGTDALAATPEPGSGDSTTSGLSGRIGWIVGGSLLGALALLGLCAFIAIGAKKRNEGSAAPIDRENLDIVTDDARHGAYGANSGGIPQNAEGVEVASSRLAGSNDALVTDYTHMEHGSSARLAFSGTRGAVEETGAAGVARASGTAGAMGTTGAAAAATGAAGAAVAATGAAGVAVAGAAHAPKPAEYTQSESSSTVATSIVENYGESDLESSGGEAYVDENMINSGTSVSHVQPINVAGRSHDDRSDHSAERSLPELDEDDDSRGI